MKNQITKMSPFRAVTIPIAMVLLVAGMCRFAIAAEHQTGVAPDQQQRLELMKGQGPDAALTILPVRLAGKPFDRVTEVVGLLLERQGLKNIELGKAPLEAANLADLDSLSVAVGDFVKANPITTGYALYAEYNGDRQIRLE